MGEDLSDSLNLEDGGAAGFVVGLLSCLCLLVLIILCAEKKKKQPSKDDIGGFDNEGEVEAQQHTAEKIPEEAHVNGRKLSSEGAVEQQDEVSNSIPNRQEKKGSKKKREKGKKEQEKKEKEKKEKEKKEREKKEKETKEREKKEKRSSRLSQGTRQSGQGFGPDFNDEGMIEADAGDDDHEYQELVPQADDPHKRIELSRLKDCIEDMRKDPRSFKSEYEQLPQGRQYSRLDALRSGLERKNRFHNILPYNHSRVVLNVLNDDQTTDYINACYIDGYQKEKAFIASQGPTVDTIPDFWRMIWEKNSSVIVMVTRLVEAGMQKCKQYWPEKVEDVAQFGDISVMFLKETLLPDYIVRTFKLTHDKEDRIVKQFHFMGWPDHGVPLHATALLNFRRKVKSEIKLADSPCVVHCSAGVGRSGTFIALDYLMDQAESEEAVDIQGCVSSLRHKRCYMVQTLDQYIFVYNAVLEAIILGETTIPCYQFEEKYKLLQKVSDKTKTTQLEEQFKILDMMKDPLREEDLSFAREEENNSKNRDPNLIPPNRYGVRLMTEITGRNNYVNAAFVDGYMGGTFFIATQMPLPDTQVDLWRIVHDYKCKTVIMLNTTDPNKKDEASYWPKDDQFINTAPFKVEHSKTESADDFTMRTLKLSFKNEEKIVLHLAVKETLSLEDDKATSVFFQLYDKVQVLQRSNSSRVPVLVHCMKGVELTGVFIAICCLCDMINSEQEVDVFRVVKHIRQARPQFISSLEQYKFLYEAADAYMKQFEDYSNFQ